MFSTHEITKKYANMVYIYTMVFFLFAPISSALAWTWGQPLVPCGQEAQPKCDFNQAMQLLNNIIDFGLLLVPFLAAIALMFAGFMYLTSAGDTGKVSKAHEIFTDTVIGIVVALAAWLIVKTILSGLGVPSAFNLLGK